MPARRRAPRLSHAERRALLVAAAVRVIRRRGLAAAQVGDVVREAGVARGTFYLHFESKRHLLLAVVRELLDRLLPRFTAPPPMGSRADLVQALATLHRQVLEAAMRDRGLSRLLLAGGVAGEPGAARSVAAHEEAWRRVVARLLARARAARLLREGLDLAFTSECVVGSVQRILRGAVTGRGEADVAALSTALAEFHAAAVSR